MCSFISSLGSTVALQLPVWSEFSPLTNNLALYLMLGMSILLVVGIVFAFTRKPARAQKIEKKRISKQNTYEEVFQGLQEVSQGSREVSQGSREVSQGSREVSQGQKVSDTNSETSEDVKEELPQQFDDVKDGVIKLFNWFYGFTQRKYEGIADNMTSREFMGTVLGKIPSEGASSLEFLVTAFEIANYSNSKLKEDVLDRALKAIERLKNLIESGNTHVNTNDLGHEDFSSVKPTNVNQEFPQ